MGGEDGPPGKYSSKNIDPSGGEVANRCSVSGGLQAARHLPGVAECGEAVTDRRARGATSTVVTRSGNDTKSTSRSICDGQSRGTVAGRPKAADACTDVDASGDVGYYHPDKSLHEQTSGGAHQGQGLLPPTSEN